MWSTQTRSGLKFGSGASDSGSGHNVLCSLFATFGVPQRGMLENGTAFMSDKIRMFYERNAVQAVTSAPYHQATNGQSECYVAELKKGLVQDATDPMQHRVSRFLF